jgi:hypothetical protein
MQETATRKNAISGAGQQYKVSKTSYKATRYSQASK